MSTQIAVERLHFSKPLELEIRHLLPGYMASMRRFIPMEKVVLAGAVMILLLIVAACSFFGQRRWPAMMVTGATWFAIVSPYLINAFDWTQRLRLSAALLTLLLLLVKPQNKTAVSGN